MINTVLIENNLSQPSLLAKKIAKCCPNLVIKAIGNSIAKVKILLQENHQDLIIVNLEGFSFVNLRKIFITHIIETELIYISHSHDYALEALQSQASEYIISPIQDETLIIAVEKVRERLRVRKENKNNKTLLDKLLRENRTDQSIGIPTMEGFVFFSPSEIIRCEGLQKCTRIITTTKTDIISSYNIGEFKKLLEPYGFFTTHKSHLINLAFVRRYQREGSIILKDNSRVPVSKRRKSVFLKQVIHP